MSKSKFSTKNMVMGAILAAIVIILQCLATYTTFFGPFSTAIGLIPIVIGAAVCGVGVSTFLGFVFGVVVLLTGGGALFWAFNIPGTIITVLAKGTACGAAAGIAYKLLKKTNVYVATVAAAIVCPVVNTGVFLAGCAIFFMKFADAIAAVVGMNITGMDLFLAFATGNFLFELGLNIVLSPIIVRLINVRNRM